MGKNQAFAVDDYIVYPSHGVGRIIAIETQEIVGDMLEMYVVSFEQDRLTCACRPRRRRARACAS